MALVVLAKNINVAGLFEVRVGGQFLLASIVRSAKAKRGIHGDLRRRFFDAHDSNPPCSILVTRVWRNHFAAKEPEIGCSTKSGDDEAITVSIAKQR